MKPIRPGTSLDRVLEHREAAILLKQQAVLFRASHHSGSLEIELTRRNIPFVKFGGLKPATHQRRGAAHSGEYRQAAGPPTRNLNAVSRVGSLARARQPKHLKAAPIAAPPKAPRAAAIAGLFIR